MNRQSHRVQFKGHRGHVLSGVVESPIGENKGSLLFSHCFTCNKDLKAIVKISRALAERGWQVLRYDFTGLGSSQGTFAESNFTTNCEDLRCAADFLSSSFSAPDFLMGHSFGGAASLTLASEIESVRGVIGIAAPSNTVHLSDLLLRMNPQIHSEGIGEVTIGGYKHSIAMQMIDDFRSHDLQQRIEALDKPMLLLHSPSDETVSFQNAIQNLGLASKTPQRNIHRSLIALPGSNHLLTNQERDIPFVAAIVDDWCSRMK